MGMAWLPQVIALFVLIGSAGPNFKTTVQPQGYQHQCEPVVLFFSVSLCFSEPGTHFRRLLRILPGEETSKDHFSDDPDRTGGI